VCSGHWQRGRGGAWRGVGCRRPAAPPRAPPNASPALPRPPSQKRCPTAFQLFPNARTIVLTPCDLVESTGATRRVVEDDSAEEDSPRSSLPGGLADADGTWRRVHIPALFRPPSAPADAAAARAALAGVTRLEVCGVLEPAQLADALRHLPGLRAVALRCGCVIVQIGGHNELAEDLVAALAGCPGIESLEWRVDGYYGGAPGADVGRSDWRGGRA
jgi:hypothetical protein